MEHAQAVSSPVSSHSRRSPNHRAGPASNIPKTSSNGVTGQSGATNRAVLVVGNLTPEQLALVKNAIAGVLGPDVQSLTLPTNSTTTSTSNPTSSSSPAPQQEEETPEPGTAILSMEHILSGKPALLHVNATFESFCKKLQTISKLENKVMKAVSAITHYQKQQQDLADNFVRLSNKYQELKTNFHSVLWTYMPLINNFSSIPIMDNNLTEIESQVGSYTVGLLVGKGHFAEVRVCSMVNDDRRLVIKAIDKQRVKNLNGLQRISNEIDALRCLRHPNILTLYNVLHGPHCVYLVTERLSSDLYEFIGEHPSGVGETLAKKVIHPIMDAVLYMHSKGFVHRDLKPENILLEYNGASNTDFYIKVCDFGLCEKVVQENTVLTEFCGSPGFMAPEMVIDRQYDGRKADFWSMGCILLELLLTAKEFSTMWMKNFQDEFMDDPSRFKRQLYSSWGQVEAILKPKTSEDMFCLVVNLLRIDPSARTLNYTPQWPPRAIITGATSGRRESASGLTSVNNTKVVDNHSAANNNNNNNCGNEPSQQPQRSSSTRSNPGTPTSSSSSSTSTNSSSKSPSSSASPSQPKKSSGGRPPVLQKQSSGQRNSLRAQTLLKLENLQLNTYVRGRSPGLGPLSPGTPDMGQLAKKFSFDESILSTSPSTGPSFLTSGKSMLQQPPSLSHNHSSSSTGSLH